MLRFASRQIAADYSNEFEQLFAGRFGTSKRSATPYPQVQFGSTRVEVYFASLLDEALVVLFIGAPARERDLLLRTICHQISYVLRRISTLEPPPAPH